MVVLEQSRLADNNTQLIDAGRESISLPRKRFPKPESESPGSGKIWQGDRREREDWRFAPSGKDGDARKGMTPKQMNSLPPCHTDFNRQGEKGLTGPVGSMLSPGESEIALKNIGHIRGGILPPTFNQTRGFRGRYSAMPTCSLPPCPENYRESASTLTDSGKPLTDGAEGRANEKAAMVVCVTKTRSVVSLVPENYGWNADRRPLIDVGPTKPKNAGHPAVGVELKAGVVSLPFHPSNKPGAMLPFVNGVDPLMPGKKIPFSRWDFLSPRPGLALRPMNIHAIRGDGITYPIVKSPTHNNYDLKGGDTIGPLRQNIVGEY